LEVEEYVNDELAKTMLSKESIAQKSETTLTAHDAIISFEIF